MKYSEIRDKYQNISYVGVTFIDKYCAIISPILTKIFVNTNITPNEVTILMILSGLIGGMLFFINNIWVRVIGLIFIHLWYILDFSDGELARIKKKYSSFGKEIDFTAHVINHPIYNLAFSMAVISLNRYNAVIVMLIFAIILALDMVSRNLLAFDTIYQYKMPTKNIETKKFSMKKRIIISCINFIQYFPNFALVFPIVYCIDYAFNTNISIIYAIFQAGALFLIISIFSIRWIKKIKDI